VVGCRQQFRSPSEPKDARMATASATRSFNTCADALERATEALEQEPALFRGRAARAKLVELHVAAKRLDRRLAGEVEEEDDHFGVNFAAAALEMRPADVDALAVLAAGDAVDDGEDEASEDGADADTLLADAAEATADAVDATPAALAADASTDGRYADTPGATSASSSRCLHANTPGSTPGAPSRGLPDDDDDELPACREIATPAAVLAAMDASDASKSSWKRGFLAKAAPDPRDPYAYIASCDDDDLTAPALHDAPAPVSDLELELDLDGLEIEEVHLAPDEIARLVDAGAEESKEDGLEIEVLTEATGSAPDRRRRGLPN